MLVLVNYSLQQTDEMCKILFQKLTTNSKISKQWHIYVPLAVWIRQMVATYLQLAVRYTIPRSVKYITYSRERVLIAESSLQGQTHRCVSRNCCVMRYFGYVRHLEPINTSRLPTRLSSSRTSPLAISKICQFLPKLAEIHICRSVQKKLL